MLKFHEIIWIFREIATYEYAFLKIWWNYIIHSIIMISAHRSSFFLFKFKISHSVFFYSGASHVSALISPITRVFLSLFLQMHDFSTFPARLIQTNGKQLPDFGNCGILPLHCTPMEKAKSLTMATSSAESKGRAAIRGRMARAKNPPPLRRRWHPPWACFIVPTANFLWNSLLRLKSTNKAAMVGCLLPKIPWKHTNSWICVISRKKVFCDI